MMNTRQVTDFKFVLVYFTVDEILTVIVQTINTLFAYCLVHHLLGHLTAGW